MERRCRRSGTFRSPHDRRCSYLGGLRERRHAFWGGGIGEPGEEMPRCRLFERAGLEMEFAQTQVSGNARYLRGEAAAPPGRCPTGKGARPPVAWRGDLCPPALLTSPAPRPGLAAPALMRSIKRIIDVEVCCEVLAGGKRSSAADTGAQICTTWLKPESRHFINGFSLC